LGATSLGLGVVLLVGFCAGDIRRVLRDEVFPINVSYNLGLAISESNRVANFDESSEGFTYDAYREVKPKSKEVYVLVIGEAARACNWQLYGYERATNPRLSKQKNLSVFYNVLTQSNTTHKSVPMMLSSIHTSEHKELYRRSGIPALFNEVGFSTYFISNQSPQGAMIDNLAHDAKYVMYMDSPRLDMQLVDAMRKALEQDRSEKILFILHRSRVPFLCIRQTLSGIFENSLSQLSVNCNAHITVHSHFHSSRLAAHDRKRISHPRPKFRSGPGDLP
jgi:lipid A ethanolaminephosphotransferase